MSDAPLYFAYGSNLHVPQMESRCPECRVLEPAVLNGYRLAFRGLSRRWGGGPATIVPDPQGRAEGLLYRMTAADQALLDGFEGYPRVYARVPVEVTARDGRRLEAITYERRGGAPRPPSVLYLHQIWQGYEASALDARLLRAAVEEALRAGNHRGTKA